MENPVVGATSAVKGFTNNFVSYAGKGMQIGLGIGLSRVAGIVATQYMPNVPIPLVSKNTIGSGVASLGLYAGSKALPEGTFKDIAKYGAYGSMATTAGFLIGDVLSAMNVSLPSWMANVLAMSTNMQTATADASSPDRSTFQ